jgi:hypothetical protein
MKKVMSRVLLENNNPISIPGIYLITGEKTERKITYVITRKKKRDISDKGLQHPVTQAFI